MTPTALTAAAASALAVRAPGLTDALASAASPNGTWFNNSAIRRKLLTMTALPPRASAPSPCPPTRSPPPNAP